MKDIATKSQKAYVIIAGDIDDPLIMGVSLSGPHAHELIEKEKTKADEEGWVWYGLKGFRAETLRVVETGLV